MYKLQITTNNHDREFKYQYEVPTEVLDWYDWLDEYDKTDGWICYKGHWSHVSDYMRIPNEQNHPLKHSLKWDGYVNDCMSSGTLISIGDDMETYRIGRFVSVSE